MQIILNAWNEFSLEVSAWTVKPQYSGGKIKKNISECCLLQFFTQHAKW